MTNFFILNVIIIILGILIGYNYECFLFLDANITQPTWFQRCGSLIVMWSVFCEFFMLKNQEKLTNLLSTTESMLNEHSNLFNYRIVSFLVNMRCKRIFYNVSHWMIHAQLFIGTFIWGYGDLLLAYFLN